MKLNTFSSSNPLKAIDDLVAVVVIIITIVDCCCFVVVMVERVEIDKLKSKKKKVPSPK